MKILNRILYGTLFLVAIQGCCFAEEESTNKTGPKEVTENPLFADPQEWIVHMVKDWQLQLGGGDRKILQDAHKWTPFVLQTKKQTFPILNYPRERFAVAAFSVSLTTFLTRALFIKFAKNGYSKDIYDNNCKTISAYIEACFPTAFFEKSESIKKAEKKLFDFFGDSWTKNNISYLVNMWKDLQHPEKGLSNLRVGFEFLAMIRSIRSILRFKGTGMGKNEKSIALSFYNFIVSVLGWNNYEGWSFFSTALAQGMAHLFVAHTCGNLKEKDSFEVFKKKLFAEAMIISKLVKVQHIPADTVGGQIKDSIIKPLLIFANLENVPNKQKMDATNNLKRAFLERLFYTTMAQVATKDSMKVAQFINQNTSRFIELFFVVENFINCYKADALEPKQGPKAIALLKFLLQTSAWKVLDKDAQSPFDTKTITALRQAATNTLRILAQNAGKKNSWDRNALSEIIDILISMPQASTNGTFVWQILWQSDGQKDFKDAAFEIIGKYLQERILETDVKPKDKLAIEKMIKQISELP